MDDAHPEALSQIPRVSPLFNLFELGSNLGTANAIAIGALDTQERTRRHHMMGLSRKTIRTAAAAFAGAALLGSGCVSYTKETTERTVPVPVAAAIPVPSDRVVTYPEGRYQLYGDGTRVPYYRVWVPSGASVAPVPPPPPPLPMR